MSKMTLIVVAFLFGAGYCTIAGQWQTALAIFILMWICVAARALIQERYAQEQVWQLRRDLAAMTKERDTAQALASSRLTALSSATKELTQLRDAD